MSIREMIIESIDDVSEEDLPILLAVVRRFAATNQPNPETRAALEEAREIMRNPDTVPGYMDVDTMFDDILNDEADT